MTYEVFFHVSSGRKIRRGGLYSTRRGVVHVDGRVLQGITPHEL